MAKYKTAIPLVLVLFVVFLDNVGIGLVYPMFSSMMLSLPAHL